MKCKCVKEFRNVNVVYDKTNADYLKNFINVEGVSIIDSMCPDCKGTGIVKLPENCSFEEADKWADKGHSIIHSDWSIDCKIYKHNGHYHNLSDGRTVQFVDDVVNAVLSKTGWKVLSKRNEE